MEKICKHDLTVEIPAFVYMTPEQKKLAMGVVKCKCRLSGWWSEIDLSHSDNVRKDYPAYRCHDCGRVVVVDPFTAQAADSKFGGGDV